MSDSKSEIVVYQGADQGAIAARGEPVTARNAPAIVKAAGRSAEFAWEEFFQAEIANAHTRKNYLHAVQKFLAWIDGRGLELARITPGDVGEYLQAMELGVPTKKLHLAALRRFFDRLVNRHACVINPAATVKAERHAVVEGKTPQIGVDQVRTLFKSIDVSNLVGLRDRAILAVLVYTAARVGAVAKLNLKSLKHDGTQYSLRFSCIGLVDIVPWYRLRGCFTGRRGSSQAILQGSSWRLTMGRKRQGPSPWVPERNRQFARHLNWLLSEACLDPKELAALLGRTEVLIYKYLQGVHLPKLHDLPELAQALNLKSCRDLIPQEWCDPQR